MQVLLDVINDFKIFFTEVVFVKLPKERQESNTSTEEQSIIPHVPQQLSVSLAQEVVKTPGLPNKKEGISDIGHYTTGYVYTPGAFLYTLPTRMFDGVIAELPFGTPCTIRNTQGRWLLISVREKEGWVQREDITEDITDVSPYLQEDIYYDADNRETIVLRSVIDDMFHAAALRESLHDVEYVSYRLIRKEKHIAWPNERPRIGGSWQKKLKGISGIHMGIQPKTHSVMEYMATYTEGRVAYVESVFPDESIIVTEIGYCGEGYYSERTLQPEEWKSLRPVFISVT